MLIIIILLLNVFTIVTYAEQDQLTKNADTVTGVEFSEKKDKVVPKDKDSVYVPEKTNEIKKLLPQTGETILSFIIILIGFSVVLFITGIYVLNRTMKINSLIYLD